MEIDLFSLIVRRFAQMDKYTVPSPSELRWRHFLEPDFAVRAICSILADCGYGDKL